MKKKLNIILFLLLVIIIFYLNSSFYVLTIKKIPEDEIIFQEKIFPGKQFILIYTHSVAQTPVWEFFEIDSEGQLILTETHFYDHGAGLPYAAFGNEIFVSEDGKFKIKNMFRKIETPLYYRVYQDRGNIFIFEDQKINLSGTIGNGLLTIDILRLNLIDYFLKN